MFSIKLKNMIEKKPSNDQSRKSPDNNLQRNRNEEGVDKAPGEERNKGEKVKPEDLKRKKVDADPSQKKDRPTT
jgi:hypothetical protein